MSAAGTPAAGESGAFAGIVRRSLSAGPAAALAGAIVLAAVLSFTTHSFASLENIEVVAKATAVTIVVGLAQMVVIGAGGMNLAVGATGGIVSVVCGSLMNSFGIAPVIAVIAGLAAGTFSGAVIGAVIVRGGFSPFIVTLAGGSILTGIALGITQSIPYYHLPDDFQVLGVADLFGIPVIFWIGILLAIVLAIVFRYVSFGRQILAFGANPRAAELNGIPIGRLTVSVYALSGFLAASAAVLLIARLGDADPVIGKDWLLVSFAAPIIGGTRLAGGQVSVLGTVLGALLLGILANGLVHWNVDVFFVQLISGLIILAAGGIETIREMSSAAAQRRQRRRA
ncbi:MAG TPA: ABC transporter permease [Bauldia sp.]|nr:ABC transporter permease [Bauldia sp.]